VGILAERKATEAIGPMLDLLAKSEPESIIHDELLQSLPKLGPAVLEPALLAYEQTSDPELRYSLRWILSELGARDERVLKLLLEALAEDPEPGAVYLASYGDPAALPHLSRAFNRYELERSGGLWSNHTLVELKAAIEELGGQLTLAQEEKYREATALHQREVRSSLGGGRKPGRNEPCYCGSGKKFKKCHGQ
jgi:hypothetical protein